MAKKKKKSKSINPWAKRLRFFTLLLIIVAFFLLPQHNLYAIKAYSEFFNLPTFSHKNLPMPTPQPLPINTTNISSPLISAEGVVVMDIPTGTILYEKNPDLRLLPASTTKIMTAIVALENYQLEDEVTVNTVIDQKPVMGLFSGEKITVEQLLYGALIHSANDAAFTLAEHYPGGFLAFVDKMNQKAKDLYLTQTQFANSIGFDDPNQFTTPKDLARLSIFALKNKTIVKFASIPQITVSDATHTYFHPLKNVNELLGKIPGVSGLKTGFTEAAGECLVTTAERNGRQILIVLLRSTNRFGETERLLDWVFANHVWKDVSVVN